MRSWGWDVEESRVLCGTASETRDHLFFTCDFSRNLWQMILKLCGLRRRVGDWSFETQWAMEKIKGKAFITAILKIAWNACIYFIWMERNGRLHDRKWQSEEEILQQLKLVVRVKTSNILRIYPDSVNMFLFCNWGLVDSSIDS